MGWLALCTDPPVPRRIPIDRSIVGCSRDSFALVCVSVWAVHALRAGISAFEFSSSSLTARWGSCEGAPRAKRPRSLESVIRSEGAIAARQELRTWKNGTNMKLTAFLEASFLLICWSQGKCTSISTKSCDSSVFVRVQAVQLDIVNRNKNSHKLITIRGKYFYSRINGLSYNRQVCTEKSGLPLIPLMIF